MKPSLPEIILGSRSPRRKELLDRLGLTFSVQTLDTEESWPESLASEHVAEYLAVKKSEALSAAFPNHLIITADTTVDLDGKLLNKPSGPEEASAMLHAISGRTHRVHTGVCLTQGNHLTSFTETTFVTFRIMDEEMIQAYIASGMPLDKAGAYGIQDWIGMTSIERIDGDYYTVMGLPVSRLYVLLREMFDVTPRILP